MTCFVLRLSKITVLMRKSAILPFIPLLLFILLKDFTIVYDMPSKVVDIGPTEAERVNLIKSNCTSPRF